MSTEKDQPGGPAQNLPLSPVTRRRFLQVLPCLGTLAGAEALFGREIPPHASPAAAAWQVDLSLCPPPPRVIHVHSGAATFWDFSSGWYGGFVDQAVVDEMVIKGLMRLTHSATIAQAWHRLIPDYAPGRTFAIKVNLNNYQIGDAEPDPEINALIEIVNAVIGTLVQFGVAPADVTVYDVTHGGHDSRIPATTFAGRCLYPGVKFEAYENNPDPYSATEKVHFNCPPPPKPQIDDCAICNALVNSDYLINMPIVKYHPGAYVTLAFKNHFGSIIQCDACHVYGPAYPDYTPEYSPGVDIYQNPHFGAKTVLTLGDCLFGLWENQQVNGVPQPWLTFGGGAPNSLFFARDPVAVDSVMADFIDVERRERGLGPLPAAARDYLLLAETAGLGVHESGDPWQQPAGSGYARINYRVISF